MKDHTDKYGIKSWAEDDRPREKLMLKGRAALSDAELIAILIGSGTREISAVDLSKHILAAHEQKLHKLGRAQLDELMKFKGIGEAKAVSIIAALELGRRRRAERRETKSVIRSSRDAYEIMSEKLTDIDHEEFWILLLSRSNSVKEKVLISRGGISGTVVDQRLIFKPAIEKLASSIILLHNHPSGTLHPSEQDKLLTKKLVSSAKLLDIPVLDHIICTDSGYFSFADEGLI
jgi:DNA repair protein RadC